MNFAHPPTAEANPPPAAAPVADTVTAVHLAFARGEAELAAHADAWQALASQPLEPNPFAEPWLALPALRAFGGDVRFAFAYGPTNPPSKRRVLLGVFPLRPARRLSRWMPGRVIDSWRHEYGFLGTPLLHPQRAAEALHALLDRMRDAPDGAALWRLELAGAEGPFARALTDVLNQRRAPCFVVEEYSRALIEVRDGDGDAYLKAALPHKRHKEYRRLERLLGERGRLEARALAPGGDLGEWVEAFLKLEGSGWKGKEGTAFQSKQADAAFFRETTRGAFERGRLLMLGLFLDGRPVALKCNFLTPPGSFAFKIAYDEEFSRHAPGVLLEMANVEHLHSARPARWMDSCAVAGHPMIDRLWRERRAVRTLLASTGRAPGDLLVSLAPLARWLKRKFKRPAAPAAPEEEQRP